MDESIVGAPYLIISDAPDEVDGLCNKTTPGADIDAAVLYEDPTQTPGALFADGKPSAYLTDCRWLEQGNLCPENSRGDPKTAEGEATQSPIDGFVSLNGGAIICRWSGGKTLVLGNQLYVAEVGAETTIEQFKVSACNDSEATTCGEFMQVSELDKPIPAGKILPL